MDKWHFYKLENFLVALGCLESVTADIYADEVVINKKTDSVYFFFNNHKVAFFELHDVIEICVYLYDEETNKEEFKILWHRKDN